MNYRIEGDTLPVVIMNLEAGESIITEGGGMSWMSPNMLMETTTNGGIGKVLGRAFSGDTLFQNIYTAQGGPGEIAVASCFPGSIKAFEITPGNAMILQKSAFLASSRGVELSMHFRKKLGSGLFGGEYNLEASQQIVVDTGHLAAMSESCQMDIKTVPGVKNILFGGEGIFNTYITGPGRVWLQTMPISNMASTLAQYIPTSSK